MSILLLSLFSTSNPSKNAIMPDLEAFKFTKIVKKEKYLQIINVLKDFFCTMTITKYILNLELSLTIRKL